MKIKVFNETKRNVDKELIGRIEEIFTDGDIFRETENCLKEAFVNIILLTELGIVGVNREVFGKSNQTDVISVNSDRRKPACAGRQTAKSKKILVGEIYICPDVIEKNAKQFGSTYREEFARVVIHGILHLAGFDHKKAFGESEEKMFEVQERLVSEVVGLSTEV
ncbi:MAG: rRNA maturation RNase YbeY [Patescibacteria group bacterium]|nr:rRNA maturation RNase YbeY [Patescibacteria group bacterium]